MHVETNVDYTYFNDFNSTCSVIDHMFVSHNLSDYINAYYSLNEELENQSDHSPLVLALKLDLIKHVPTTPVKRPRRKWNQTDDQTILLYKSKLDDYLSKICIPTDCLNCKDMLCKCITHVN